MLEGQQDRMIRGLLAGGVAVSENLSRRFGIHLGDSIELGTKDGTHAFKVSGVILDYTSDMGSLLLDRAVYLAHWGDTRVDTFVTYLRPDADIEAVRHEITQRYGEEHNLFVLTHAEWRGQIEDTLDQVFALMRTLEILAIVIAALGVVNALLANVLDRVREIGVLRAIGTLRRQLRRVVVIEAVLVGTIGALSGALLGLELADVMLTHINVVQTGWYFSYHAPWLSILGLMLITLPISAFAGWYPAREAAVLNVCEALSYE
jgi:putative ABC transport system permease protein